MKRRDTERDHAYAHEVFEALKIYDIQGILKEGDTYKCGIEAYQVSNFSLIRFDLLNQEEEKARYHFCNQLNIPYLIIIISEFSQKYRIYNAIPAGDIISYQQSNEYTSTEFVTWWRRQQSFTQKKGMYNAGARISESRLDTLLFANSLAWGVNVDGFTYDTNGGGVKAIFEKRIRTWKHKLTVSNYDPDNYFDGTPNRSGDYPSWQILFALSQKLGTALVLMTFDTSAGKNAGLTRITGVSRQDGLNYLNNVKPFNNIFNDNIPGIRAWLNQYIY